MSAPFPIEPIAPPQVHDHATEEKPQIHQRVWGLAARTDPTVSFEEFRYWAKIERAEEIEEERKYRQMQGPWSLKKMIKGRFSKGVHHEKKKMEEQQRQQQLAEVSEKGPTGVIESTYDTSSMSSTEEEWKTASRALRTASWGSIFFLITTDILGWSSCPYVFSSVGYGPGIALYIIFGLAAGLSGFFLWKVFMTLDSSRYPMCSYGDLFLRVFGPKTRHAINVTQSFQQFCSVMVLILGNGQIISQLAGPKLCFIVAMIIAMVVGILCGSIRSLQRLGWLCNLSVWLNIVSFIIIMVASSKFGVDYTYIFNSTRLKDKLPVMTFAGPPPDMYQQQSTGFSAQFNAVDSMVYAYSGAILFVAFMAEMRHPMDFWKGMICAQAFICSVYILFGAYVYSNYGQYSGSNISQVIEPLHLQVVANVFSLLTGFIACILYFNVGMKTVYIEVFQEVLNFPPISSSKGRWMWYALGPCYWIIAFCVAAAVPNLNGIVNFVGGLLGVNFTYSLPAILFLGWMINDGASLPGEGFDPATGVSTQHDHGPKRWMRGYMAKWHINTLVLIYALASLATSGMGTWAAVEGLISIFGPGGTVATSFGCASPA
ncbi:Transmembrane amino acid transporter family protein [Penicillium riverlandense]|uniref:Transmembrane amino acid transporter family protein n=1 Tax=Penicillium riverlandense TaxID=1903569 RepID=UPI002549629B|nr:Transmembrane amino acid transporter family protein [Penicillium riverlandense]KAJ5833190.1 Transmembrane amino acid transporter family protein [Penicillium riverlandense]